MTDKLGPAKFDFDFEPFESGVYLLVAKETDMPVVKEKEEGAPARKGPKNDFNYQIQFVAEGGEMNERMHYERFQHISQGHIGLKKLQACMIKMEVIKASSDPSGHDTSIFDSADFKKRFQMMVPGRKIVAIIKKTESKGGGVFSNIVAFYHVNELKLAQEDFAKKFKKGPRAVEKEAVATGPLPGVGAQETEPSEKGKDW